MKLSISRGRSQFKLHTHTHIYGPCTLMDGYRCGGQPDGVITAADAAHGLGGLNPRSTRKPRKLLPGHVQVATAIFVISLSLAFTKSL